jgi:hypothetical protein
MPILISEGFVSGGIENFTGAWTSPIRVHVNLGETPWVPLVGAKVDIPYDNVFGVSLVYRHRRDETELRFDNVLLATVKGVCSVRICGDEFWLFDDERRLDSFEKEGLHKRLEACGVTSVTMAPIQVP